MIEAKELRIGNCICTEKVANLYTIIELYSSDSLVVDIVTGSRHLIPYDKLKGIQLNDITIEKIGFVKYGVPVHENARILSGMLISLYSENEGYGMVFSGSLHVNRGAFWKYLYQLQNAFHKITNKELDLTQLSYENN